MLSRTISSILYSALLFLLFTHCAIAQVPIADTTSIDTTTVAATADSLGPPRIPLSLIGSIDRTLTPDNLLTDSIINFTDYRYLGDLLSTMPGMFIRDFGTTGPWQQVSVGGMDARSVQFLSDGVPLNDAFSGQFDLYLYPTENIERIERISGTRAFLYGLNGTGGTFNLVTKNRKAIHPYSHIRYSEAGYGYSIVDGLFSQDILRGLNLSAGAFHHTFGGRFANSDYDQWNGRARLRYNISNSVNLFASEMFNQTYLGLWGGVNIVRTPTDSLYDRINATIQNSDAYEKLTRHDLQAGIAFRSPCDTNAISTLTIFYSTQLREYRDEENRPSSNGVFFVQDQDARWYGARVNHQRTIGEQPLEIGAEIITRRALAIMKETQLSAFGRMEFPVESFFTVSPYARLDNFLGFTRISSGSDITANIRNDLHVSGGFAQAYRYPTLQEARGLPQTSSDVVTDYERSSLGWFPERHRLWEGVLSWHAGRCYNMEARFFHRIIDDAIVPGIFDSASSTGYYEFRRNKQISISGAAITGSFRLGSFVLEGEAQYLDIVNDDDPVQTLPRWSATGGIFFWDTLSGGHLNLKIGLRGRTFSSYVGREFNTLVLSYTRNGQATTIDASAAGDFFVIAKLGDAYIHFIMENLFDRRYVMNTFYPITDRTIRFGVSWEFSD